MGIPAAKGKQASLSRLARLAAAAALAVTLPACAHGPAPGLATGLATLEIYDRQDGRTLPVYDKDGQRYVVGTPGHEYALRLRNVTAERILAVTSVDGVNVISGETASPDQSGYVLEPYGSLEVAGWRKSFSRTAAFYFTDLGDSYAARTGRPGNVGVIGVALFRERVPYRAQIAEEQRRIEQADAAADANAVRPEAKQRAAQPAAPLGTGHGRSETSYVTQVAFERDTRQPAQIVSVRYDRRDNLVAMGVLPPPWPSYAERTPSPFPGSLRFAPDPH
jgi:hypothetical protein